MINTLRIFDELKETMEAKAAQKIAEIIGMLYEDLQNTVTKKEFNELKDIVGELAEAQKRTEQRVNELAEAQKRTEQRINELAEAQKRTEEELRKLVQDHRETRRQLGGLAMVVGYTLENEAYKALPRLLKEDYNISVKDKLRRQYVKDNQGKYIEVNIVGKASKSGKEIVIVGEGKSQLSKNDIDRFRNKKLNRLEGVFKEMFPLLVTHMTTNPDVEEYAKKKGITLYYSYDF